MRRERLAGVCVLILAGLQVRCWGIGVTINAPEMPSRDQNEPVAPSSNTYTAAMKTAENRGFLPEQRVPVRAEKAFSCSWFESRYPSSKNAR
jgi:hypothetical protein